MAQLKYDILDRRDTLANWASVNPTLEEGQIGYETNTKRVKIGDGITAWNDLDYQFLTVYDKGIPNGVVPLNASGEIDASYINQVAVASTTQFDPAGNLIATDVQAAIEELDSEKEPNIPTGTIAQYIRANKTLANFQNDIGSALDVSGIISGGEVTLNADPSKLNISACQYFLQGVKYSYAGATGLAHDIQSGQTARRLGLNSSGLVTQQGNFNDTQKLTILPIARIQSVQGQSGPGSNLNDPIDLRYLLGNFAYNDRLWRENTFGLLYTETGGEYSENTTPLRLNQAAGVCFDAQGKKIIVSQTNQILAKYVYHVSGVYTVQTDTTLVVNTSQYDNGTDLVSLTTSYWTAHTLLRSPKAPNDHFIVVGNAQYTTQTQAEAQPANYGIFVDEATSGLVAVAKLVVRSGSTIINRIVNIHPRINATANKTTGVSAQLPTVSATGDMSNYEDAWRHFNSATISDGCATTDNGNGTFNIAAGDVVIRSATVDDAPLSVYRIAAAGPFTPVDNAVTYYYINYNNGSPVWTTGTNIYAYNGMDKVQGFTVSRRGTTLWILDARGQAVDGNRKARRRDLEWSGRYDEGFWHTRGGTEISASGLSLILTAGKFYYGVAPTTHIAFDTTVAGTANANVFDYYYNRSSYTTVLNSKTINNTQYDNAGTLTAMSPGRYRTDWVYLLLDGATPRLIVVMGNIQYNDLITAQAAPVPTTKPAFMQGVSVLVGRVIANNGSTTLNVATPFVAYVFQ